MHPDAERTFGERLAQARRALGVRLWQDVSQDQLAKLAGVAGGTVSRWEAGKATPGVPTKRELARVLGVRTEWLDEGHGPMYGNVGEGATASGVGSPSEAPVRGRVAEDVPHGEEHPRPVKHRVRRAQ